MMRLRTAARVIMPVMVAALMLFGTGCKKQAASGEGKPFPEIKLMYNTSESHKIIAEAIQQMWKKELGITVSLENKEWKTYLKDLTSLNYNIARAGWIADYNDPNTFVDMFVTKGGNNQTGWSNKEYDALVAQAAKESDPEKRMKILSDAEVILMKEMPIMPIYFYVNTNLLKTYVKGMAFNTRDLHPLKTVYLEKKGKVLPPNEQVFKFSLSAEPETLDPGLMTGATEFTVAVQLFEGLVVNDPQTLEPRPGIATSWEVSSDKKLYTFHLRKDAKWTNGDPVTANDFVYSWKRVLTPATASEYAYQLFYIKNANQFYTKKIKDFSQVGVKALDDYTLQVELENPTHFWLDLCAFHTLLPVNQKSVDKFGDKWTRPENIVTNGPFKLTGWTQKSQLVMEKNPTYYGAKDVKLSKVIAFSIEDNITAVQMFKAEQTYWVNTIPLPYIDDFRKKPEAHFTDFMSTYYYRFNVTKAPLDDIRVRQALDMAVDKEAIVKFVTKGGQKPATTFVPPLITGYTPPKGLPYDPKKARALLREAGYAVNVAD